MTKYEKLIEYIISDQEKLAKQLFHEIVVEKSREIYEGIIADEDDEFGGDEVDDFIDDIEYDEDGIREADEEDEDEFDFEVSGEEDTEDDMDMDSEDDMDMDMDVGDEDGMDAEGDMDMDMDSDDGDLEDRILDLETAMDELRAEFAKQDGDDFDMDSEDDMEMDTDMDAEGDMDMDMDTDMDDEESDFDVDDEINQIREYVEKITNPTGSEGKEVGKGGSFSVNKTSTVAKKNDMGGTTKNLVKGGSESNPDGTKAKEPSNYATKNKTKVKHADKFENVPTAKTKGYMNKKDAVKQEPAGVNKTSVEKGSK